MQKIGGNQGIQVQDLKIMKSDGLDSKPIRYIKVPIVPTGTTEQLSGLKLPAGTVVLADGIFIDVTTLGGTVDLGTAETVGAGGGDANGFVAALSVASTGQK